MFYETKIYVLQVLASFAERLASQCHIRQLTLDIPREFAKVFRKRVNRQQATMYDMLACNTFINSPDIMKLTIADDEQTVIWERNGTWKGPGSGESVCVRTNIVSDDLFTSLHSKRQHSPAEFVTTAHSRTEQMLGQLRLLYTL